MPQLAAEPRYAVYHAHDPRAMLSPRADRWLDHQALHFRHVADVQADELDQVFALTNHQQEESWTSHPEIVWHAAAMCRCKDTKKARCVCSTPGPVSHSF